jgi:hypothetical protein
LSTRRLLVKVVKNFLEAFFSADKNDPKIIPEILPIT